MTTWAELDAKGTEALGSCANWRCRSTKATTFNLHDRKWYCHWCAQTINAKAAQRHQEKVCITHKDFVWRQLSGIL